MYCDQLSLDLEFYYKTDDDAIKGKEELKQVFGANRGSSPDYMVFNRKHNKIHGGRYYSLNDCSNDLIQAYIIRITEILEKFEKKFPTKWESFWIFTSIHHRKGGENSGDRTQDCTV